VSGGLQDSFIVHGNVSQGDPVGLVSANTIGKVIEIFTPSWNTYQPLFTNAEFDLSAGSRLAWDDNSKVGLYIFGDADSTGGLQTLLQGFKVNSGGTVTQTGSIVNLTSTLQNKSYKINFAGDFGNFFLTYKNVTSVPTGDFYQILPVHVDTGTLLISTGSSANLSVSSYTGINYYDTCVLDTGEIFTLYYDGTNDRYSLYEQTGTTLTFVNDGLAISVGAVSGETPYVRPLPGSRVVMFFKDGTNASGCIAQVSGGSATFGGNSTILNPGLVMDLLTNPLYNSVTFCVNTGSSELPDFRTYSETGTTLTFIGVSTGGQIPSSGDRLITIGYDSNMGEHVLFQNATGGVSARKFSLTGSTITFSPTGYLTAENNDWGGLLGPGGGILYGGIASFISSDYNFILPVGETGSLTQGFNTVSIQENIIHFIPDDFVGIANTSGSTGDTVVVNLRGGVDGNQSGLIFNQPYYLDVDGTIGLTGSSGSTFFGRALSSTEILLSAITP
jgi:hypothetical protein